MTATDMELRMEFLRAELEREVELLAVQAAAEAPVPAPSKRERKACVGKILLELGSLQMRLKEADRRG